MVSNIDSQQRPSPHAVCPLLARDGTEQSKLKVSILAKRWSEIGLAFTPVAPAGGYIARHLTRTSRQLREPPSSR